ncbi:ABC transporter permease [Nocardioides oleivorans]|uniref:ABC transporter permease n=1 Tax=Nocardioides oleivorans TaxID=273676 RepID=A0A4Q2S0D4_9ACTN|nr:ABC transporter permease [Nocardioides oleivorans]RYB93815.1 ABC transporter permease [Nocardioides oleivorans]
MRTVLTASLRHHTRRYVAASLAVIIGVAFVVVTGMLTGATRSGLTADVGAPVAGLDHVVTIHDSREGARLLDTAAERDVPSLVIGYAMEPVSRDGVELAPAADVSEVSLDPALQWQELEAGRFPAAAGEALADANAAKSTGVEVGDTLRIGTGDLATDVEVVGLVDSPAGASSSLYVPWSTLEGFRDSTLWVDAVAWGGSTDLAAEVAPGATIESAETWVAARQAEISRGVDVIAIMALVFVFIALFVGVLVIANTFAILFAQRQRDFALLRCVGVTRRQLRRAIRLEALAMGVVASVVGILVGTALGYGLVALVHHWYADMGAAAIDPRWTGAALAVGVVVALAAAWLPTRAATKVAPLAALRPDTGVDVRSTAGRLRLALAALFLLAGALLMAVSIGTHTVPVMLGGGAMSFLGVLLLGPVLVPALIRLVGRVSGSGPVRQLATGNAVRNPRRTATTAASLLVGVTLTTAVLTGLASSRTEITREMDDDYPVDASITAVDRPLDADLASRTEAVDGVASIASLAGTTATIGKVSFPVVGATQEPGVVRGTDDLVPDDGVLVLPYDVVNELPTKLGDQVWDDEQATITVGGRERTLRVELSSGWGRSGIVSAATLAALDPAPQPTAIWVRAGDGADAEDLRGDLAALAGASGAGIDGGYSNRTWVDLQVDILTGAVVGLLAIAIVIALVGIANTLGASVLERGRENALLRAMGLTRSQLRRAMAVEGLLLSSVATLIGTTLGLVFAWVGVKVMVGTVVEDAGLTVPVLQLATVVVVAALAGLAACVVPARKAARVTPAAGLALD